MSWVDSHCHLHLLDAPPEVTVAAARAEGVTRLVTVGVDLESSAVSVELARRLPGVAAPVGVHPNDSGGFGAAEEAELSRLAEAPEVAGIGEAGFDNYRNGAPKDDQERSFRAQIDLAKRLGTALVVHTRDAHAETKRVLAEEGPPERLVMHCFSGDERDAADYLDLGAVLSFAGNVTFRNAGDIQRAARACPIGRLLLETDSPFLSPHPFRGTPNSPSRIPAIGASVAELKGVAIEELAEAVGSTSERVWAGRGTPPGW